MLIVRGFLMVRKFSRGKRESMGGPRASSFRAEIGKNTFKPMGVLLRGQRRAAFRVFRGHPSGRRSVEKRRLDKNEIRQRRQQREDFMNRLYQAVDGNVSEFVQGIELAAELPANPEEARRIIAYLEEKGWIKVDDHRNGVIRITAAGVDAVETTTLG